MFVPSFDARCTRQGHAVGVSTFAHRPTLEGGADSGRPRRVVGWRAPDFLGSRHGSFSYGHPA
eukprot:6543666-Lingulodinium_polyedra.AAC.1